jgi:hypothetical protein
MADGATMDAGKASLVVLMRESATGAEDAAAKVYAWNERKKRFSPRQIGIAFETLRANGWLAAA